MIRTILIVPICIFVFVCPSFGDGDEINIDDLMKTVLPTPSEAALREYLGLKEGDGFAIPDIPAKAAIIEIFSMYCPHCQREAPDINRLYEKISADEKLGKHVKFIGIGAGNSDFEVGIFKKKFKIAFPLFSDSDFAIHKKLGEVRTPYFIGVELRGNGTYAVFHSKSGGIPDHDGFLELLRRHTGDNQ